MFNVSWKKFNRTCHYWIALACALPVLIIVCSGGMLLLKKEIAWIQPPSAKVDTDGVPKISFETILQAAKSVPQAGIHGWEGIDRLDVRPGKGIIKVRGKNNWEVQVDHSTGEVLKSAYRRSDIIESIHDGSFFHEHAKLWVFLPSGFLLLLLWITGVYLFIITEIGKRRSREKQRKQGLAAY